MGLARNGVLLAAVLVLPATAHAQSDAARAAARDLGAEGVEYFQAGNYQAASEKLGRAFEILRAPSLGLWSARALAKTGKLLEASERYLEVTRLDASKGDTAVQKQAQADAATEREALQARIPALTLDVKGASGEVSVTLDGAAVLPALLGVRQPANPGKHAAEARQGARVVRGEVTLAEGQRQELTLDFAKGAVTPEPAAPAATSDGSALDQPAPAPSEPSSPTTSSSGRKVPAGVWVGLAVTGVGLATGGITAGLAAGKKADLDCPNDLCRRSQSTDVDAHNQLLTISTIGFIAAGVGLGTAGVFWFTRPRDAEPSAHVTPWLGIGSAGVRGTF